MPSRHLELSATHSLLFATYSSSLGLSYYSDMIKPKGESISFKPSS